MNILLRNNSSWSIITHLTTVFFIEHTIFFGVNQFFDASFTPNKTLRKNKILYSIHAV